jgi:hypothetical protein
VDDFGQPNPFNLLRTCKNQQAMLVGKATHNNKDEEKFFLLGKKNFT